MISGNRGNNGLGPVIIRCRPDATRQRASARTAAGDGMGRTFQERMCKAGFGGSAAVENAGAGYYTLAHAFSGRRDSAPHRANMLNRGVTHMGIAAAYAPCGAMVSLEVILPRPAKQELHRWTAANGLAHDAFAKAVQYCAGLVIRRLGGQSEPWRRVNRHLFVPGCGLPRLNLVRSLVDTSCAPSSGRPRRR
jgi:hypothetical protein